MAAMGIYGMNWFLAYLLIFLNLALLVSVGIYANSWKSRVIGWILLILPVPLYMLATGYFTAYYQHVRDCKEEGGLKVLIRPDKAEGIRLDIRSFGFSNGESDAKGVLHKFYPRIKTVEAFGNDKDQSRLRNQYFAFSVASTNISDRNSNWEREWKFNKIPLQGPSEGMYEISKSREDSETKNNITKYVWKLTKNNKTYIKYTEFIHKWAGIRYPDAVPFWSCEGQYSGEYQYPVYDLIELTLNKNLRID